jgi:UDP-N-acetylglucosamine 2-epimerase
MPKPKYNLKIGSGTHGQQTGKMLAGIEDVLLKEKPDWVLIYGDTNSTLAGALAAAKIHIPVAHIEAGLRSFNRRMPEEINSVVADHLSTVLFCPSQFSVDNLAAEGIPYPLPITHYVLPITHCPLPLTFHRRRRDGSDALNICGSEHLQRRQIFYRD